ncbi:MAG: hypothetical protein AAF799_48370 [Myxococcota bacterium]
MLTWSLTFGLLMAGPTPPCPIDAVADRVAELAPDLGRPQPTFDDGVLSLEFSRKDEGAIALLTVQLADGQMATVGTSPVVKEVRESLNELGPKLATNQDVLQALVQCPAGSTTAQARADAWEKTFHEKRNEPKPEPNRELEPEPEPSHGAHDASEREVAEQENAAEADDGAGDEADPEQSSQALWLTIGGAAVLLVLFFLLARRRTSDD